MRRRESPVKRKLISADFASVVLCSVGKAELYFGAQRSALPQAELARRGAFIGPNDLLIASIAPANEATLVTHNTAEFERVDGLQIEDWHIG